MAEPTGAAAPLDEASVRDAWDRAADAYAHGQASGRDFWRYEFLGPAHVAACGDVAGARLLDVGCGSGYLAREMAERGAQVVATDISPRMIAHALEAEAQAPLGIAYEVCPASELDARFAAGSFEVATSCVALQDMPDPAAALRSVRAVLRPGGRFVASITHPCTDTPFHAWERDDAGRKRWLCTDRYFDRTAVEVAWGRWEYPFTTPAVHAPLEDWFRWIVGAGFAVRAFLEPTPSPEAIAARPPLASAARVPYFVIFDLAAV